MATIPRFRNIYKTEMVQDPNDPNKKVVKTLREKKKTLKKNDRVFTYRKGNDYFNIQSSDVNKYLKQFGKFSAKNFRTWGANIELIVQINKRCKKDVK